MTISGRYSVLNSFVFHIHEIFMVTLSSIKFLHLMYVTILLRRSEHMIFEAFTPET